MDYDDAYANAPYIEGAESYPARWQAAASAFADRLAAEGRRRAALSYGPRPRERYDLFVPQQSARGLMLYVHGGYWLKFDRTYWFHLAEGALARGYAVGIPSYDLCPDVRISDITRQIAAATNTVADLIDGPIILTGHSAGGHLVARMLTPGLLRADVAKRLRRVMPVSPISDLRPLMQTRMNTELRIDAAEAGSESPVLLQRRLDVPVTVWVGGIERPVFLDQARWLVEAWGAEHVIDPGRHHFNVIDGLGHADTPMIDALFA